MLCSNKKIENYSHFGFKKNISTKTHKHQLLDSKGLYLIQINIFKLSFLLFYYQDYYYGFLCGLNDINKYKTFSAVLGIFFVFLGFFLGIQSMERGVFISANYPPHIHSSLPASQQNLDFVLYSSYYNYYY